MSDEVIFSILLFVCIGTGVTLGMYHRNFCECGEKCKPGDRCKRCGEVNKLVKDGY